MKLTDLNPRWIHPNIFIFDCPCGCKGTPRATFLTCKNMAMDVTEQYRLISGSTEERPFSAVATKADTVWVFMVGDQILHQSSRNTVTFMDLSVTPSIDASASGHWHGCITNGKIQ